MDGFKIDVMTQNDTREVTALHYDFDFEESKVEDKGRKIWKDKKPDFPFQIRNLLRSYLDSHNKTGLIVRRDLDPGKEIIAFVIAQIVEPTNMFYKMKRVGQIDMIYVKPKFRKKGIAGQLMKMTENWFIMNKCELSVVKIVAKSPSRQFYERLGYGEVEITLRKRLD